MMKRKDADVIGLAFENRTALLSEAAKMCRPLPVLRDAQVGFAAWRRARCRSRSLPFRRHWELVPLLTY